jgi:hypothetical protein
MRTGKEENSQRDGTTRAPAHTRMQLRDKAPCGYTLSVRSCQQTKVLPAVSSRTADRQELPGCERYRRCRSRTVMSARQSPTAAERSMRNVGNDRSLCCDPWL